MCSHTANAEVLARSPTRRAARLPEDPRTTSAMSLEEKQEYDFWTSLSKSGVGTAKRDSLPRSMGKGRLNMLADPLRGPPPCYLAEGVYAVVILVRTGGGMVNAALWVLVFFQRPLPVTVPGAPSGRRLHSCFGPQVPGLRARRRRPWGPPPHL